jgi:hypothetical protein
MIGDPRRRATGYLPGFSSPGSCDAMSSDTEDAGVKSSRARACDFRRLRFSRNASFSRSCRSSLLGLADGPSRLSLPSVIVDPFEMRPPSVISVADPADGRNLTPASRAGGARRWLYAFFDGPAAGPRLRRWGPCGKDRRALLGPFWPILISGHAAVAQW